MAGSRTASEVLLARLVPLTCCIVLGGCTTTLHDLAVSDVSVTDSAEWFPPVESRNKRTNRLLLRVDLTTKVDLGQAFSRWDMLIHANAVFCSHPDDDALLGFSLYTTAPSAGELPRPLNSPRSVGPAGATERTYYLPLNIAAPATLEMKLHGVSFDLLGNPEDLCISLRGASLPFTMKWHYVRSNTVRVSRDAIREVLNDAQSTDRPSDNR